MNGRWINLGRDMALVDESGRLVGRLIPKDERIAYLTSKSLYEPYRSLRIDGDIYAGRPPDREERKGA